MLEICINRLPVAAHIESEFISYVEESARNHGNVLLRNISSRTLELFAHSGTSRTPALGTCCRELLPERSSGVETPSHKDETVQCLGMK